ncbi:MAG TPA: glycosyltransferase family 9 protein [Bryobacteraceae bacterium]|nr:glycosyltransferase family 9 protein [Bryobacteraceae bacterium]
MNHVLDRLPAGSRVAVLRLRSLGDCVLTTPALALLKQARPDLELAVVVEDPFSAVFQGNPAVNRILSPSAIELVRWRPRLTINLHGGTRSLQLTVAARARFRAGFGHFRFQPVYNIRIPRAQQILGVERPVHTAEHLASAMFYLGVPESDVPRARLYATQPETGDYAVLHPFASEPEKTWGARNFIQVAHHLQASGIEPVFVGALSDDFSPFNAYRCLAGAPLETVKNVIAGAALFIGNDSGPAHIAAAFGKPVMVFFGRSDAAVWGPWKTESTIFQVSADADEVLVALPALLALPR